MTSAPLVFSLVLPVQRWMGAHSALARQLEARDDPLAELPASTEARYLDRQVVLVGYGRVGRRIADALAQDGVPFVVADHNRERVEALRKQGLAAVLGDATEPAVLIQAHIARAHMLVVATPDTLGVRRMIEVARTLNPQIKTVVRSHSEEEARRLEEDGAARVFLGERELADAMVRHVMELAQRPG